MSLFCEGPGLSLRHQSYSLWSPFVCVRRPRTKLIAHFNRIIKTRTRGKLKRELWMINDESPIGRGEIYWKLMELNGMVFTFCSSSAARLCESRSACVVRRLSFQMENTCRRMSNYCQTKDVNKLKEQLGGNLSTFLKRMNVY